MFANHYTAFIDACTLASVLRRNLLLSLAEAAFFRIRWSAPVLDETERAIEKIHLRKHVEPSNAQARAMQARQAMETAFQEAMVTDFENLLTVGDALPDPKDRHVLAAALKAQAATIVTENLNDFPEQVLAPLNLMACAADGFIADTISLNQGRAVAAIRTMRLRLKRPEKTPEILLLDMEAAGLTEAVNTLQPHIASL